MSRFLSFAAIQEYKAAIEHEGIQIVFTAGLYLLE